MAAAAQVVTSGSMSMVVTCPPGPVISAMSAALYPVVPISRTPGSGTDAGLVDHVGLEPRGADRRQGDAIGVLLVPDDIPPVAVLQRSPRHREGVPGNCTQRRLDRRGRDVPLPHELVGHRIAQLTRPVSGVQAGGLSRHGHHVSSVVINSRNQVTPPRPCSASCHVRISGGGRQRREGGQAVPHFPASFCY